MCNNCRKHGHYFHQCKLPVTSYGIILFRVSDGVPQFLMIRRRHSFGYIEFIRGKYASHNTEQIQVIIDEMAAHEKADILQYDFKTLWIQMWDESAGSHHRSEEHASHKKFDLLKSRQLDNMIRESPTRWTETEWEFPKGRRDYLEKDVDCALREFEEETGISKTHVDLFRNVMPFEEIFVGSNQLSYKHKYFLGQFVGQTQIDTDSFQTSEVSKMEWKTLEQCLTDIRPYNFEKRNIIQRIHQIALRYV